MRLKPEDVRPMDTVTTRRISDRKFADSKESKWDEKGEPITYGYGYGYACRKIGEYDTDDYIGN